jgi:hypothetical protein
MFVFEYNILTLYEVCNSFFSSQEYELLLQGGFVDRLHCSVLHGDQFSTGCEAHTNVAEDSACPMVDNVRNAVVTIQRSRRR